jgi:hypothetical protein
MEIEEPLFEIKAAEINKNVEQSLKTYSKYSNNQHGCSILATIMLDESAPNLFIEINTSDDYIFQMYTSNLPKIWQNIKSSPCLIRGHSFNGEFTEKYGAKNINVGERVNTTSKYIYIIDIKERIDYYEACFYKYGVPSFKKLSINLVQEDQ